MGGPAVFRNALLVGGAAALILSGANVAVAQDDSSPAAVEFNDPTSLAPEAPALNLNVRDDAQVRFASPNTQSTLPAVHGPRRLELELAAGGGDSPVDVSLAQRAMLGADPNGDIDRRGSGSELRIGRGLVDRTESMDGSFYAFVASDNEALTWRPGARSEFGGRGDSWALQEQVEIGDMSAGITYERNGVQASLAYVEREESIQVGAQSFTQDQSFTGLTVTMRR